VSCYTGGLPQLGPTERSVIHSTAEPHIIFYYYNDDSRNSGCYLLEALPNNP
jgi:hypothetical protein